LIVELAELVLRATPVKLSVLAPLTLFFRLLGLGFSVDMEDKLLSTRAMEEYFSRALGGKDSGDLILGSLCTATEF
jgi:hypothetical protein